MDGSLIAGHPALPLGGGPGAGCAFAMRPLRRMRPLRPTRFNWK